MSRVCCPSQSRAWRARTGSVESRELPTRSPSVEDTLGVGAQCGIEAEAGCSLPPPPPSQAIHASTSAHQLTIPSLTPTCRRLWSGSWWTSSRSCRIGGHPPSKACMAPSMEEGVQGGLGWEALAQGSAPLGQGPLHPAVGWVGRTSAGTGFWNGRCTTRNNKTETPVLIVPYKEG